jgi:hypothetical protein
MRPRRYLLLAALLILAAPRVLVPQANRAPKPEEKGTDAFSDK